MSQSAKTEPLILVVHGDRKTQRIIHRILGATLSTIDVADDAAQALRLLAVHTPALLVVDHRLLGSADGERMVRAARDRGSAASLVLLDGLVRADLPRMFGLGSLTNLLANPMPLLAEELATTALKLLRRDIFGLEKYMGWGTHIRSLQLTDAAQRASAVDQVDHDVRGFGLGARTASLAMLIAEELLANALYNAPVDAAGARLRAGESRHQPRPLGGREQVSLRYACDARYLAIEVADHYGSLERETILASLARGVDRGRADQVDMRGSGAGMGIAMAYGCSNHLVFNLHPGRRTEAIGLIDVRFRPAELGGAVPSFNVFVERGDQP